MRNLRFRVWNGTEMVYNVTVGKFGVFYVNPSNNGLDPNDSDSLTPFTTKYHEDTPIMQYTGLKDRNGVEVYEGDVVRVLYTDWPSKSPDDPRTLEQYQIDISKIGEIVFEGYEWCVKNGDHYGTVIVGRYGWMEVIGSIYSNPELLQR